MGFIFREKLESRHFSSTKDGITAIRVYHIQSDLEEDKDKILNPDDIYNQSQFPSIGSPHPTIPLVYLTSNDVSVNTATTNRGVMTSTYATRSPSGDDESTPDSNGETWTWNMVSQTTNINSVLSDNGKPRQTTYDGRHIRGAKLYSALNFDDEGVYGFEVYRPASTLTVSKNYPIAEISHEYRNVLRKLQNTVNKAGFPYRESPIKSEFEAGCLLFLGADITYNIPDSRATVTYSFQFGSPQLEVESLVWKEKTNTSEELQKIKVDIINPFQVVWSPIETRLLASKDGKVKKKIKHLASVNVADVYGQGDFFQFKIIGGAT